MERITISLKSALANQFDEFIRAKGYSNRSEAMRDLIRDRLEAERYRDDETTHCVAVLSYVFNHGEFDLPNRLSHLHHRHQSLAISSTHVHLNATDCLDTITLRGPYLEVRAYADRVIAERGVRHGRLNLIPAEVEAEEELPLRLNGHARVSEEPSVRMASAPRAAALS